MTDARIQEEEALHPHLGYAGRLWMRLSSSFYVAVAAAIVLVDVGFRPSGHADLAGLVKTTVFCGVASALLIETVKRLTPVRALYQSTRVLSILFWQHEVSARLGDVVDRDRLDLPAQRRYNDLDVRVEKAIMSTVGRMGAGTVSGAFNLPVEQLMPQLVDEVSNAVLPRVAKPAFADSPAAPSVDILPPSLLETLVGMDLYRERIAGAGSPVSRSTDDPPSFGPQRRPELELERRAGRMFEQMQTNLGNTWRYHLRAIAACVSGLIGLSVAYWAPPDVAVSVSTPIAALLGGGFVAWLTRDITAVIERNRR